MNNLGSPFELVELDEELVPFLEEDGPSFPMIRHPLVYSIMHSPVLNGLVNQQLRAKKERILELEAEGKFDQIIAYYERPYRLEALMKYASSMSDGQYWQALGWIWTDTENVQQLRDDWLDAFGDKRPGSEALMNKADRAMYDALPDAVIVYRGQSIYHPHGMSWTTRKDIARWFAKRFEREDMGVFTGAVRKQDIIACMTGRRESEVIVLPHHVKIVEKVSV